MKSLLAILFFVSNFAFAGDLGIFVDGLNQKYRIYYQYSQRVIVRDENGGGQTWIFDTVNPENSNQYSSSFGYATIEYLDDYTFLRNGELLTAKNQCE